MAVIIIGAFISGSSRKRQRRIMSTKGQIIIPADIRKKYRLKKGEKLMIEDEDGYIKMISKTTNLASLCGILK